MRLSLVVLIALSWGGSCPAWAEPRAEGKLSPEAAHPECLVDVAVGGTRTIKVLDHGCVERAEEWYLKPKQKYGRLELGANLKAPDLGKGVTVGPKLELRYVAPLDEDAQKNDSKKPFVREIHLRFAPTEISGRPLDMVVGKNADTLLRAHFKTVKGSEQWGAVFVNNPTFLWTGISGLGTPDALNQKERWGLYLSVGYAKLNGAPKIGQNGSQGGGAVGELEYERQLNPLLRLHGDVMAGIFSHFGLGYMVSAKGGASLTPKGTPFYLDLTAAYSRITGVAEKDGHLAKDMDFLSREALTGSLAAGARY